METIKEKLFDAYKKFTIVSIVTTGLGFLFKGNCDIKIHALNYCVVMVLFTVIGVIAILRHKVKNDGRMV